MDAVILLELCVENCWTFKKEGIVADRGLEIGQVQ